MRSSSNSTTLPAFSAAFLLQFLGAEAEFEALCRAGTVLGERLAGGRAADRATNPQPPSPERHTQSLTALLASELGALARHLEAQAAPAHIFALAEEHRPAAYRLARIAELLPQLHSLAVLFANLEILSPPDVDGWEPATTTMAPEAAAQELRRRLRQLAGTLRLAIGGLRRQEQRLPIPRGEALETLLETSGQEADPPATSEGDLIALSGAMECLIADRLAATIASLEATAELEWGEDSARVERVLEECDPDWPATEALQGPPLQRDPNPVASLRATALATARQLRPMADYLNSRLAALPATTPSHLALTAQTDSALVALADAVAALEGVGE